MSKVKDALVEFGRILKNGRKRDRIIGWVIVLLFVGFVGSHVYSAVSPDAERYIPTSDFVWELKQGNVGELHISNIDGTVSGKMKEPTETGIVNFTSHVPERSETFTAEYLSTGEIQYDYAKSPAWVSTIGNLLFMLLQVGLLVGAMAWLLSSQMGDKSIFPFGDDEEDFRTEVPDVTFADVAGIPEAIEEVSEIVTFLKDPDVYESAGAKCPHGVLLEGDPGVGKALPLYWPVLTEAGWKAMGELEMDDVVFDKDGNPASITGIYPQEDKLDVWEVSLADGRIVECCKDHLWAVLGDSGYDTMSTESMFEHDLEDSNGRHRFLIPLAGAVEFPSVDHDLDPYVMGVLLGAEHGSVHRDGIVDRARKDVGKAKLEKVVIGNFVPKAYMSGSIVQRTSFLRGLMDAGGQIENGHAAFCSHSRKVARAIAEIARSIGVPASLKYLYSAYTDELTYEVMFWVTDGTRIFDDPELAATVLDLDGAPEGVKSGHIAVTDIRPTKRKERMQCISVDSPSKTYIIDEYVVTHNTLLARALAGEAGVNFLSASGSDFVKIYVGQGAKRVRELFAKARKVQPCIVFIDEIDAVGGNRDAGMGMHDEHLQTINALLAEMDGFKKSDRVIVLAATNRGGALDPALVRPGRFDRIVSIDTPAKEGRKEILQHYAQERRFVAPVDFDKLAAHTYGFSGAQLENVINQAATLAARRAIEQNTEPLITEDDLEEGIARTISGPAMKSKKMNDEEKKQVAYHEAGHAVVQYLLPECDPVQKISIVSRHIPSVGTAMGYVQSYSEEDSYITTAAELHSELASLMAGRCSEKLYCGIESAGASDDLRKASKIAYSMVDKFAFESVNGQQLSWRVYVQPESAGIPTASQKRLEFIDNQVDAILDKAYDTAYRIVSSHRKDVERIVAVLLEEETIDADRIKEIMSEPGEEQ